MIIKNNKRIDGCSDTVPIGTLNPFLGSTAPYGYLICQGQKVSKMTYKELYDICGDTFGQSTDTEFYLPDLRGQTIAGYKEGDSTFGTLGGLIGSLTHLHSTGNHTLTVDEMPSHKHTGIEYDNGNSVSLSESGNTGYNISWNTTGNSSRSDMQTNSTGGSQPHNHGDTSSTSSVQPTIVLNWIVKAFQLMPNQSYVENNLESDSTINSLSAKQGRLLNDTLHTVDDYMHALRTGIYMQSTNGGALITFDNAKLYNMMQIKLWGNGYGDIPIDTIIQGYHYKSLGNFTNCKQHNNSANLGACKWKIINGKIALWVPCLGHYSSLVIDAYETLPDVRPILNTVELMDTEPAGDVSITCTIV